VKTRTSALPIKQTTNRQACNERPSYRKLGKRILLRYVRVITRASRSRQSWKSLAVVVAAFFRPDTRVHEVSNDVCENSDYLRSRDTWLVATCHVRILAPVSTASMYSCLTPSSLALKSQLIQTSLARYGQQGNFELSRRVLKTCSSSTDITRLQKHFLGGFDFSSTDEIHRNDSIEITRFKMFKLHTQSAVTYR